jgi:hypothetical protein
MRLLPKGKKEKKKIRIQTYLLLGTSGSFVSLFSHYCTHGSLKFLSCFDVSKPRRKHAELLFFYSFKRLTKPQFFKKKRKKKK